MQIKVLGREQLLDLLCGPQGITKGLRSGRGLAGGGTWVTPRSWER